MGTNYYWRDRICVPCGRYDEIHVCKSGSIFRAYQHVLLDVEHPDWGYSEQSPFGEPVLSRADWVRVLTDRPGELYDEYGDRVDEPAKWLASVEPPTAEQIRWQDNDRAASRYRWRDPEGFRFYAGEFS